MSDTNTNGSTNGSTNTNIMPSGFVRNQWYVAASVDEVVAGTPLARTICGEHLVLFRKADDSVAVLADRCPHRGYPLSLGQVVGDELQCGYHGLKFDSCGTCTWAPLQNNIPSRANVMAYPTVVTGPWIWVWIGDTATPDMAKVPHLPWLEDPAWTVLHGMEPLAARYGLLVDNLLDLSHESFLHAGYIGTPEVALTPIETDIDEHHDVVRVSRHMSAVECPPFYSRTTGLASPIDRWQDIEYHPVCCYVLHSRISAAGVTPHADGSDPEAAHVKVLYGITPTSEGHTLDFWALCRDFAHNDAEVDSFMSSMQTQVVMQDVRALNILETRLASEPTVNEVSLKIDTGALAARRMISRQQHAHTGNASLNLL